MEKYPSGIYGNFYIGVCVIWLYENYFNFVKQTMILWFARGYLYFRRCVLNGLEVACYKICNLLLHKLAKVCTSDVCKLYGYTCVCVVYVGCVFVWHGWYTLYITCMYTTSHVCIYVCVCCVARLFQSHSLFTIYTSKHRSGIWWDRRKKTTYIKPMISRSV